MAYIEATVSSLSSGKRQWVLPKDAADFPGKILYDQNSMEKRFGMQQWVAKGWLEPHVTSPEELANLPAIVDRDLSDTGGRLEF
uniref:Uncharacterized protein n=1 Tax=Desulfobacca acetoxidans TaxID=60893 RepID=A0A7C3WRZ5_9BACT